MPTFNNFGATEAMVLLRFATGGYTAAAADFGGSPAIADALDGAAFSVVQALPPRLLDRIQHPDLLRVEGRASSGQTVMAALPLAPHIPGKVHVWAGPPQSFTSRPRLAVDPWGYAGGSWGSGRGTPTPPGALTELDEAAFSVSAGGVITLATPLARNDQVFASYDVDVANAAFSMPSLADLVADGAAAALGGKVYPQASAEWAYVSSLAERWTGALEELGAGRLVPSELRALQWWQEPERTQEGALGSVRRFRG